MKIIIDDRYFIETDRLNYILKERYISQKKKSYGKEVVNTIGYYNNLESLAERYLEECEIVGNREVIRCERCGNVLEIAEMEEAGIWEDN